MRIELTEEAREFVRREASKLKNPAVYIWHLERAACYGMRCISYTLVFLCEEEEAKGYGVKIGEAEGLPVYLDPSDADLLPPTGRILIELNSLYSQDQLLATFLA